MATWYPGGARFGLKLTSFLTYSEIAQYTQCKPRRVGGVLLLGPRQGTRARLAQW